MRSFLFILMLGGAFTAFFYARPDVFQLSASGIRLLSTDKGSAPSWTPPAMIPSKPDWTWTTLDGKTYTKVQVVKVEADGVTILHANGGGFIPITKLSPDMQKLFNYDTNAAALASEQRRQTEQRELAEETQARANAQNLLPVDKRLENLKSALNIARQACEERYGITCGLQANYSIANPVPPDGIYDIAYSFGSNSGHIHCSASGVYQWDQ